jgi:hypothetical protein
VEHLVLLLREIVLSAHDDHRRSVGKAHVLSPQIMPGLQAEARSSVRLISQYTRARALMAETRSRWRAYWCRDLAFATL